MTDEKITLKWNTKGIVDFFSNAKVQWALVGIILVVVLLWSSSIRVSNLPLLKDQTTGEYIPLALDPFYFLRAAQTLQENGGALPEFDPLRQPFDITWTSEILPDTVYYLHKLSSIFGEYSIQYIDVISPVIFYIIGLIAFFILTLLLTKSKIAASASAIFLAFIPSYLYRSMAGFADHESIGMAVFFITLIPLVLFFSRFEQDRYANKHYKRNAFLLSLLLGILTTLTIVSWGGIARFTFLIIPFSFLIFWIVHERGMSRQKKNVLFGSYVFWMIAGIVFGALTRYGLFGIARWFTKGVEGSFVLFVLGFILVDLLLSEYAKHKVPLKKYRILASAGITLILGFVILFILGTNPFDLVGNVFSSLLQPFGTERVSLTVAENKQPFLEDWTNQIGPRFFWIFLLGALFLGAQLARTIKTKKDKIIFTALWAVMILGISLSRISSDSLLNGTNLLSKTLYFGGILVFILYSLYLYFNKKIEKLDGRVIVFAALLLPMLIGTRGAIRLFFVITPVTCMMVGFGIHQLVDKFKAAKDDLSKVFWGGGAIAVIILLIISLNFFVSTISAQAQFTGPSANVQWQEAMQWTRENVQENATFLHWWDYGYWVQYLGERATLSDGGRFQGAFRDHLIGRYFLTNPNADSALSFMKSNNVTHILIDPTDIGKYSAYSSIGSDDTGNDRYSWIPALVTDPRQTQETNNSIIRVYQGGSFIDSDIIYDNGETQIFLPQGRAALIGVIVEIALEGTSINQPEAVFLYNNQQIRLPIKNVYFQGNVNSFASGIDTTIVIIPLVSADASGGASIDQLGAMMYLSQKTQNSFFSQMYLMNDPLDNYPTITIAHSEPDPIVANFNAQGAQLGEFVYYQGIRGPIKIWEASYPENIVVHEEFLRFSGAYGEFDTLTFRE